MCTLDRRSVNVRCRRNVPEWARQESNLHATGYEPAALAVELRARAHRRAHRAQGEMRVSRPPDSMRGP